MWININDVLYNLDHYSHIYTVEGPDCIKLTMCQNSSSRDQHNPDVIEFDSREELAPIFNKIAKLTKVWDEDLTNKINRRS